MTFAEMVRKAAADALALTPAGRALRAQGFSVSSRGGNVSDLTFARIDGRNSVTIASDPPPVEMTDKLVARYAGPGSVRFRVYSGVDAFLDALKNPDVTKG